MPDNPNQGGDPRNYNEALSRAFERFSDSLVVSQGRPTRFGLNPRIEMDVTSANELIELRKCIDEVAFTGVLISTDNGLEPSGSSIDFTGTYPTSGSDFYVQIEASKDRFIEYQPGETIEIVDKGSDNEQSHIFCTLLGKEHDKRMYLHLQMRSDSPSVTGIDKPLIYRAFRRQMYEFTKTKGASTSIDRTRIIRENDQ